MNCPKCNTQLDDNAVICPVCGDHFAVEMQRNKFWQTREKTYTILSDVIHSRLFLIFSIFLSVLCGTFLLSAIQFDLISALCFAFSLIGLIGAWQLYSGKSQRPDAPKIKQLRFLPKTLKIIYNVFYVLVIVVTVICIIALSMIQPMIDMMAEEGFDIMETVAQAFYEEGLLTYEESLEIAAFKINDYLGTILVALIIAMAIVTVVLVLMTIAFKKMQKFTEALLDTCQTGTYQTPKKFSHKFVFTMGIIIAIPGAFSILGGMVVAALSPIALGGYMITFSLLMKEINEKELRNNKDIAIQEEILARVADLTNKQMYENAQAQATAEETPTEETPVEEAAAEETPVEDAPVEDAPTEDNSNE